MCRQGSVSRGGAHLAIVELAVLVGIKPTHDLLGLSEIERLTTPRAAEDGHQLVGRDLPARVAVEDGECGAQLRGGGHGIHS